ncbi:hypothetical protein DPMN_151991 [Dreissena polymorpha]|uniref:Uncharacterized protein n=1 Tax=Dreissena polymorpha TaxID=45954 RepID=A0A9D4FM82_DREPO|nr:hypothetical protein DPMN_151991 [Dreissena polymorpha]
MSMREQMWDKFLIQKNVSGQGGIQTRDLSFSKPAFYHYTTVSTRSSSAVFYSSAGLRVLSLIQSVKPHSAQRN